MKVSIKILFIIFTILMVALYLHCLNNNTELWTKPLRASAGFSKNRVVAISAYFDPRSQQSHNNATVILLSVEKSLKNSIVGCEVDGLTSMNSSVEELSIMGWVHARFKMTHTDCIMYCWDMEVNRDSVVKVLWKINNETRAEPVRTAVVTFSQGPERNEVMVCATGFGGPIQYLDQWLTYHQTIGVKFIHLNVVESFIPNINSSVLLSNLIDSGTVYVIVWEVYLNSSQVYYYSQTLKYLDCIFRYQNSYRYMMIIDFDEYFIPAGKMKNIYSYVATMFKAKDVGSIYIPALVYPCKKSLYDNITLPSDGNITKLYNTSKFHFTKSLGKSIHKVQTINMIYPHKAVTLFPTYRMNYACQNPTDCRANCYIAHISTYQRYKKIC